MPWSSPIYQKHLQQLNKKWDAQSEQKCRAFEESIKVVNTTNSRKANLKSKIKMTDSTLTKHPTLSIIGVSRGRLPCHAHPSGSVLNAIHNHRKHFRWVILFEKNKKTMYDNDTPRLDVVHSLESDRSTTAKTGQKSKSRMVVQTWHAIRAMRSDEKPDIRMASNVGFALAGSTSRNQQDGNNINILRTSAEEPAGLFGGNSGCSTSKQWSWRAHQSYKGQNSRSCRAG
jgi:hypothetical protein